MGGENKGRCGGTPFRAGVARKKGKEKCVNAIMRECMNEEQRANGKEQRERRKCMNGR
jgi:hypothetical protein